MQKKKNLRYTNFAIFRAYPPTGVVHSTQHMGPILQNKMHLRYTIFAILEPTRPLEFPTLRNLCADKSEENAHTMHHFRHLERIRLLALPTLRKLWPDFLATFTLNGHLHK